MKRQGRCLTMRRRFTEQGKERHEQGAEPSPGYSPRFPRTGCRFAREAVPFLCANCCAVGKRSCRRDLLRRIRMAIRQPLLGSDCFQICCWRVTRWQCHWSPLGRSNFKNGARKSGDPAVRKELHDAPHRAPAAAPILSPWDACIATPGRAHSTNEAASQVFTPTEAQSAPRSDGLVSQQRRQQLNAHPRRRPRLRQARHD